MSDRLTVKEFAIRAGVSPQRIYKLLAKDNGLNNGLSNRLKPYIIIENNQKYLDIEALKLFEEKFELLETEEICSTYPLTPSQAADLIAMTPLTQGIEKEQLDLAALTKVTIHLHILAGRPR